MKKSLFLKRRFAKQAFFFFVFLVGVVPCYFFGGTAQAQDGGPVVDNFEGVYDGSMVITSPKTLTIPLQLSLVLSEEDEAVDDGNVRRINGAFLVDDEAGPYAFSRVSLRLDTGRLDMRYMRSGLGAQLPTAASLLFSGQLKAEGVIAGTVTSGVRGAIGTFSVKRKPSQLSLIRRTKYFGDWSGTCTCGTYNGSPIGKDMRVYIAAAATSVRNPEDFELEFTPGKTGGVFLGAEIPTGLIQIDYLRRRIKMSTVIDGAGQWSLDGEFDTQLWNPALGNHFFVGYINTPYRGQLGHFTLERLRAYP